MARVRTGKPNGRPRGSKIPLKNHPNKLALALADVLQGFAGLSAQKARLWVTIFMTGTDARSIPFSEMSEKARKYFEKGWVAMSIKVPGAGNPASQKIKEHFQAIDTLDKMAARYSSPADLSYRRSLAAFVHLSMFAQGNETQRRAMVELLLLQLDDPDPQLRAIADQTLRAG